MTEPDDTQHQRNKTKITRAIITTAARDKWTRTHCHITLTQTGQGVTHNPACSAAPPHAIRWTDTARQALARDHD